MTAPTPAERHTAAHVEAQVGERLDRLVAAREGRAVIWAELVERTDDHEWTWDACIVCGNPDTTTRGLVLEDGPAGALRRIAWCHRPACESDRDVTDYLLTPRAAASESDAAR